MSEPEHEERASLTRRHRLVVEPFRFTAPTWVPTAPHHSDGRYEAQDVTVHHRWSDKKGWKEEVSVLATHLRKDGKPRRHWPMTRFGIDRAEIPAWFTDEMRDFVDGLPMPTSVITIMEADNG